MTTRAAARNNKNKKPLETTLGKAPTHLNGDSVDLSHIRKPIDTSIFGLSQVLSLFETATDEVRKYLAYECDIMYECRICRTIFRSLANFVLHKRNYCRELFRQNEHKMCQHNSFYVIDENEQKIEGNLSDSKIKQANETAPEPQVKDKKNLKRVLSGLLNKQESTLITEQCLTEDLSSDSKSSNDIVTNSNVALQRIDNSKSGVFQTIFHQMAEVNSKMDLMKTEVMEIHDILENNEAIIGPDGKISVPDSEKNTILINNFICTVCNQKFSTKKTLKYHINYKHNDSRLVFKCPECQDTFANAWCVFRHLYKIHRKTPAQVKRLRNEIYANKVKKEEQPKVSEKNQKNSRLKTDPQGKLDLENQQWMDDLEGDNDLQRCGGCGRKFERKAALHSHSQFCTKRIAVCNTIKENNMKRVQLEEKQEKLIKTVKTATPVENEINGSSGSRRRKPLVARKLWRYDYIKDVEKTEEVYRNSEKGALDKTSIVVRDFINDNINNIIEAKIDECKEKDKTENTTNDNRIIDLIIDHELTAALEQNKIHDKDQNKTSNSDDIGYLNTIQLPAETINTSSILKASLLVVNEPHVENKEILISDNSNSMPFSEVNKDEASAENESLDCVTNVDSDQKHIVNNNNHQVSKSVTNECSIKRKIDDVTDLTESSSKYMKSQTQISLEAKASNYIDKEKFICRPCRKTFKSSKSLMKHMALHFNWFRYQCRSCQYMTYQRSKCERHVEQIHVVQNKVALKTYVFHIPVWKTIEISTNFRKCCKKHHFEENLHGGAVMTKETVPETCSITKQEKDVLIASMESTTTEDDYTIITENEKPNSQDPSVRQMIMEVIFGSDISNMDTTKIKIQNVAVINQSPEGECPNAIENNSIDVTVLRDNSRPIRNRTIPIQKDFLYDMKQMLKPKDAKDKQMEEENNCEQKPLKVYTKKLRPHNKKCAPHTMADNNGNVASVAQQDADISSKD